MIVDVSGRSFEEAIEAGLLRELPAEGTENVTAVGGKPLQDSAMISGGYLVRSGPGTVKLSDQDTKMYIKSRWT